MTDEERTAQLVMRLEAVRVELAAIQTALQSGLPAEASDD
jgi:hypothetical protein